jgi:hypothetical protein
MADSRNMVGQNGAGQYWGGAGGMMGAGLANMLSDWQNPSDSAMPYLNNIPGTMKPYYDPYINAGRGALNDVEGQYGRLTSDPGGRLNEIGQGYHESPGFKFALQQALQGGNHAAAAGGMAGSPMHEQQNMQMATNLGNQDYNNWMRNALGMYSQGLQGQQGIAQMGYGASNELAQSLANNMMSQAMLKYAGTQSENEHEQGGLGAFLGGAGQMAGMAFMPH